RGKRGTAGLRLGHRRTQARRHSFPLGRGAGAMSDAPGPARRIDRVCDAFEAAWLAGVRPAIEQFLGDTPEPDRSALFRELLAVEVEYRVRGGGRSEERRVGEEGGVRGGWGR